MSAHAPALISVLVIAAVVAATLSQPSADAATKQNAAQPMSTMASDPYLHVGPTVLEEVVLPLGAYRITVELRDVDGNVADCAAPGADGLACAPARNAR